MSPVLGAVGGSDNAQSIVEEARRTAEAEGKGILDSVQRLTQRHANGVKYATPTTDDGEWVITLTAKDLFMLALVVVNLVMISYLGLKCAVERARNQGYRHPVVYGADAKLSLVKMSTSPNLKKAR